MAGSMHVYLSVRRPVVFATWGCSAVAVAFNLRAAILRTHPIPVATNSLARNSLAR